MHFNNQHDNILGVIDRKVLNVEVNLHCGCQDLHCWGKMMCFGADERPLMKTVDLWHFLTKFLSSYFLRWQNQLTEILLLQLLTQLLIKAF
jgi:hypothetical protein